MCILICSTWEIIDFYVILLFFLMQGCADIIYVSNAEELWQMFNTVF